MRPSNTVPKNVEQTPKIKARPPVQLSALDWQETSEERAPEEKKRGFRRKAEKTWQEDIPRELVTEFEMHPDGIYEHMGKLMVANKEREDRMWEISNRLCLATVYGARTLGPQPPRGAVTGTIQKAVTKFIADNCPRVELREEDPVLVEELNVPTYFAGGGQQKNVEGTGEVERTSRVWVLVTLPESTPEEIGLFGIQAIHVLGKYAKEAVILTGFPWELPDEQWFGIKEQMKRMSAR